MQNSSFHKFRRLFIDSMLLVLFFGLLALPISFMGLTNYRSSTSPVLGNTTVRPNIQPKPYIPPRYVGQDESSDELQQVPQSTGSSLIPLEE